MVKFSKKLLSLVLVMLMVVSMIPASVFAAEEVAVALPTATVTQIENEELTFALNFKADQATEEQLACYGDWHADFVLTINKDVTFNADGSADGYLSGQYDEWSENWVDVPFENVTRNAGESLKIMEYAREHAGYKEALTYQAVYEGVQDFDCGVYFTDEFLAANPDLEVTLELRVYNPDDLSESYAIGETYEFTAAPELPTATVSRISNDELSFAMNFKADAATAEQLAYYGDWYADFVLTVNKEATFNADGTADGYLSGQYDEWSENWVDVPYNKAVTLAANTPLKIMEFAAELMGKPGLQITCNDVYTSVKDFDCGVFFSDEFLAANPDLEVTLELRIYNPADESESYAIGDTYDFTVPELPTATVTEIENDELTFAMNFKADEASEEQLYYYGNWYADFVLTINKDVTFNADGSADGYLSGQYDEWSENWVDVPYNKTVTLAANTPLRIMEYAAELMGKTGLKYTYAEVYESVKDFDCGVYFSDEFLAANPDLEVTLELRAYNPADESVSYAIGESYFFTHVAMNVQTGAYYRTVEQALNEANEDETVQMINNSDESGSVLVVLWDTTLDLNGYKLTAKALSSAFAGAQVIDSSDNSQGLLEVAAQNKAAFAAGAAQLPVWIDGEGFRFVAATYNQVARDQGNGAVRFLFYFQGEDPDWRLAKELENGGTDNGIEIGVRVEYVVNGNKGTAYFVFLNETIIDYAVNWPDNMVYMTIDGMDSVESAKFYAVTSYGEVEIVSEAAEYAPAQA